MAGDNADGARVAAGRYRLQREIGRGGMGIVWQATDTDLQREVAVKEVLLPDHLTDAERADAHARVRREAQSAARVSHPSVITLHDVFEFDGHPWVVMELIRGRSLQEEIAEHGPLAPSRAAAVAASLLEAVRAAHLAGVVHRDIKPGNVMVCEDGRVVLTDFGIATVEGGSTITRTGTLIGSPEYMSPERLDSEQATPASDLWSVGVTLHTVLEGQSPFQRDSITAAIAAVLSAPIPQPRNAGPLAPVINGLLHRAPEERLTADAALALLREQEAAPTAPAGGSAAPYPSGPSTPHPSVPNTPHPSGPSTPFSGGPAMRQPPGPHPPQLAPPGPQTGPSAPFGHGHPVPQGPYTASFSAGPAPHHTAPNASPARRKGRRGPMVALVSGIAVVGVVVVMIAVFAFALANLDTTEYQTFRSDWFTVDYPHEWGVDDSQTDTDGHVYFEHPDKDHSIYVNAWQNEGSDHPDSSYGWVKQDDNDFRDDEAISDYQTVELEEVTSSPFPDNWDVSRLEAEFSHDGWSTEDRHFQSHIIMIGSDGYAITMNIPAEEAGSYDKIYESVLESFQP